MKEFVLPKFWYIPVTKENRHVLQEWRLKKATNFKNNHYMRSGCSCLVSNSFDGSYYFGGPEEAFLSIISSSKYKKITFDEFKTYVLKEDVSKEDVPDFRIPGTKIPFYYGVEYRCVSWKEESPNTLFDRKLETFVSYGYKIYKGEIYILIEIIDYPGINFYMLKESALIELYKKEKQKLSMRTITHEQAQSIIDIACTAWKTKLADKWAVNIVKKEKILIQEEEYQEMRKSCDRDQNALFDTIFGKDETLEEGTPCLVKDREHENWQFRYADGKGAFRASKTAASCEWKMFINLSKEGIPEYN